MFMDRNLMALAIIPGLLLIIYVYTKDKVEKEPLSMIIKILLLGMASCFIAGFVNSFRMMYIPYPEGTIGYAVTISFTIAALDEELLKFLALRIGSWRSNAFNYRFDGIVYGLTSAVGFAIFENVDYVMRYGLYTAIIRAFTAVPMHAFCGVFMGAIYAYSKKASIMGMKGTSIAYTLLSLIVPMLIHGTYDTFAFMGQAGAVQFWIVVIVLYAAAIITIKKMSAADYRAGFYPAARPIDYDINI